MRTTPYPEVVEALRSYLAAEDACRKHPLAYSSFLHGPGYAEYKILSEADRAAYAHLWAVTDFEYEEDGFREHVWNWRYWKVMARKCCWYQQSVLPSQAAATMSKLGEAERNFVRACGLEAGYRDACSYLEEAFPGLKKDTTG